MEVPAGQLSPRRFRPRSDRDSAFEDRTPQRTKPAPLPGGRRPATTDRTVRPTPHRSPPPRRGMGRPDAHRDAPGTARPQDPSPAGAPAVHTGPPRWPRPTLRREGARQARAKRNGSQPPSRALDRLGPTEPLRARPAQGIRSDPTVPILRPVEQRKAGGHGKDGPAALSTATGNPVTDTDPAGPHTGRKAAAAREPTTSPGTDATSHRGRLLPSRRPRTRERLPLQWESPGMWCMSRCFQRPHSHPSHQL